MSYAHILGTMYELCSYYDNGFFIDELRYIISSMTFIMTPTTVALSGKKLQCCITDLNTGYSKYTKLKNG